MLASFKITKIFETTSYNSRNKCRIFTFLSKYCHHYFNPKPRCARGLGLLLVCKTVGIGWELPPTVPLRGSFFCFAFSKPRFRFRLRLPTIRHLRRRFGGGVHNQLMVLREIKGTVLLVCYLLCWKSKGRLFWFVVCFAV